MAGIVGFATFQVDKAYVPHLFVADDWRLAGVASGLLDTIRRLAGRRIELDVDCLNDNAIAFYRRSGWTIRTPAGQRTGVIRRGQLRLISP